MYPFCRNSRCMSASSLPRGRSFTLPEQYKWKIKLLVYMEKEKKASSRLLWGKTSFVPCRLPCLAYTVPTQKGCPPPNSFHHHRYLICPTKATHGLCRFESFVVADWSLCHRSGVWWQWGCLTPPLHNTDCRVVRVRSCHDDDPACEMQCKLDTAAHYMVDCLGIIWRDRSLRD